MKIDAAMIVYCSFIFILDLSWVKILHPTESPDWVILMEKNSEGLLIDIIPKKATRLLLGILTGSRAIVPTSLFMLFDWEYMLAHRIDQTAEIRNLEKR